MAVIDFSHSGHVDLSNTGVPNKLNNSSTPLCQFEGACFVHAGSFPHLNGREPSLIK